MSAVAATAFAVIVVGSAFAQESGDQQKCINGLNKDTCKVAAAQGKENKGCVKEGTKGTATSGCLTADAKGKVAKKKTKTTDDETKNGCLGANAPDFGYTTGSSGNTAAMTEEVNLFDDVYGTTDPTAVISTDKLTGGCQSAMTKDLEKLIAAKWKQYVSCKKASLKAGALNAAALEACLQGDPNSVAADPKGKIGKKFAKFAGDITKKCPAVAVNTTFPGSCNAETLTTLPTCLDRLAECRLCLAINAIDGLSVDCDLFDDGLANASCGAAPACPLAAGRYTITNIAGGNLTVASIGPFPFPAGGTVVQDVSSASLPDCVHTTTIPFPGGFSAPQFCIPVLNFNVIIAQTGCGVGRIDSNGGSDFTVHEIGDTSAPSAPCALPDPDCNAGMLPDDNNLRVDVTVGDGLADTCAGGTTANAISVIPVETTTWTNPPLTCPDPDGQYDPGTDTLITQFPQILDFTTDSNKAEWMDIDVDGCSIAGVGPAAGFTATGVCIDNAFSTVTTGAAGAVASKAAPLHDLTFRSILPSTFSGPIAGSSSCGSPPAINFAGTATRCLSAP
jgi:hypothetical protein